MLLRFFSFHGDFNFLHKLHSHFRLQVWFGSYSSCAVADRVLIKSESHSGSVNMHSCAFFFLPGFLPAVLQARERESSAGIKSLVSLAHTLIPPDNPPITPPLTSFTSLDCRYSVCMNGRELTLESEREERGI